MSRSQATAPPAEQRRAHLSFRALAGLWTVLVAILAGVLSAGPILGAFRTALLTEKLDALAQRTAVAEALWRTETGTTSADVQRLANLAHTAELLRFGKAGRTAELAAPRAALSELFIGFMKTKPRDLQARVIGAWGAGPELLRVERETPKHEAQAVPVAKLQDKGEEPYFKRALMATMAQPLTTSGFTWNREYGRISEPRTLMVRHIATLFDGEGLPLGFVVINVGVLEQLTDELLAAIPTTPDTYGFVIQEDGRWLMPPKNRARAPLIPVNALTDARVEEVLGADFRARLAAIGDQRTTAYVKDAPSGGAAWFQEHRRVVAMRSVPLTGGGFVVMGLSASYAHTVASASSAFFGALLWAVLGLAAVSVVGWLVVREALARINHVVQRLSHFDLTERVLIAPPRRSVVVATELERLVHAFNQMATRVWRESANLQEEVAQHQRTQDRLAVSLTESEAVNRELHAFAYSIVHDLRSPLRGVTCFAQAIELDAEGRAGTQ